MKRCFIFAAGSYYGLRKRPREGDFLIAADAGYRICQHEGIVPDLLLGDFDSMPQPENFEHTLRVPVEKDDTDTMLAVKMGLDQGCTEFYIYGATGGARLDHTLANLQALIYLCERGAEGYLYDMDFAYTAIKNTEKTFTQEVPWGILSCFCFGADAKGITMTGVQYPMENGTIGAGFPLGVSNHFTAPEAKITVKDGTLLIGWQLAARG